MTPEELLELRQRLDQELADGKAETQRLTVQKRETLLRIALRTGHDAMKPEVKPAVLAALLDWEAIDGHSDVDSALEELDAALDELQRDPDARFLWIPELMHLNGRIPASGADGGARSIRDDELPRPGGRVTRRSARDALQRGYGHGRIIESRGASRVRELREEEGA